LYYGSDVLGLDKTVAAAGSENVADEYFNSFVYSVYKI